MDNFQKKVDQIFGPTLYKYYNGPINSVIGSKIKDNENTNVLENNKSNEEYER